MVRYGHSTDFYVAGPGLAKVFCERAPPLAVRSGSNYSAANGAESRLGIRSFGNRESHGPIEYFDPGRKIPEWISLKLV